MTLRGIKNFNEIPDVKHWKGFLANLPDAKTSEQRSINKYHCRMYYFDSIYKILVNIFSVFVLLFQVAPKLLKKSDFEVKHVPDAILVEDAAVRYSDVFPTQLKQEYRDIKTVKNSRSKLRISQDAKIVFKRIWKKNFLRPHYSYWLFRELAFFSELAETYTPKAIIVYVNERNVVSPILTEYLEDKGIKFITFMHGDYILQLIQGFMEFSEFYVWDEHYVNMFVNDLYCPAKQFKLYVPQKLEREYSTSNEIVEFTYYLGFESEKSLKKLGFLLSELKKNNIKCQARLHPRQDNKEDVYKYINPDQIQDPKTISIDQSINQSTYIVALNSTVLLESYYGGKKIMLDDWTDPAAFQSLKDRKAIIFDRPHYLLSHYLRTFDGPL